MSAVLTETLKGVSSHPLDSLSASELEEAAQILREEKKLGSTVRFASITLHEPSKSTVFSYKPGAETVRQAFVVMLDRTTQAASEAVVDLVTKSVVSFKQLPAGIQPSIMLDEFFEVEKAVRKNPEFLAALERRGIKNPELVMVEPWSAGLYGTEPPDYQGRRLMRALCFVRAEPTDNGYAHPIDSMVVVVDVNKPEVLKVEEYGPVPLPAENSNWAREYITDIRTDLKPIEIVQPEGVSFTVNGHEVAWQKWKFRVGFTSREGLVLHTISYTDETGERPILHRASISEMVVPYGDPGEAYYRKNAFDIGEYGIGMLANSLKLGCDCLGVIHYFDFPLVDSQGKATVL